MDNPANLLDGAADALADRLGDAIGDAVGNSLGELAAVAGGHAADELAQLAPYAVAEGNRKSATTVVPALLLALALGLVVAAVYFSRQVARAGD